MRFLTRRAEQRVARERTDPRERHKAAAHFYVRAAVGSPDPPPVPKGDRQWSPAEYPDGRWWDPADMTPSAQHASPDAPDQVSLDESGPEGQPPA